METNEALREAAIAVKESDALLFTAGAGMGVDSGLPDFRGNEGFWKAYQPIAKLGISFMEMANPRWFKARPLLAWAFYGHRLNMYRRVVPHPGFRKLLEMAEKKAGSYFVFTSNVDGQFQKAGFEPEKIVECHGSIHHFQCVEPCSEAIWDAYGEKLIIDEEIFEAKPPLPVCPNCGGLARPNILMFGDWGWLGDRTEEQEYRFSSWLSGLHGAKIAVIECGAGTSVPTVRYKSESVGNYKDNVLIRINPREAYGPRSCISIPLGAEEGISAIFRELNI